MQLFDRHKLKATMDAFEISPVEISKRVSYLVRRREEMDSPRKFHGISRQCIEHILKGTRLPTADDLGKIASILHMSPNDFYGEF